MTLVDTFTRCNAAAPPWYDFVSHDARAFPVRGHYDCAANGNGVTPDFVFGWELPPDRRRPNPYPVHEASGLLQPVSLDGLVVDELKPGVDMAKAAGVDTAAAGWSQEIPAIREFTREACAACLATFAEFAHYVLRQLGPAGAAEVGVARVRA